MRKLLFVSVFLTVTSILNAQLHTDFKANIYVPANNLQQFDFAVGGDLALGFTVKKKFDISFTVSNLWCMSGIPGFQIRSVVVDIKYFLLQKSIRPYVGIGSGLYRKIFENPFGGSITDTGIGLAPKIGLQYDTRFLKGLYWTSEISYNYIFTKRNLNLFNIEFGVGYYFRHK